MNPFLTTASGWDYKGILQRLEGVWIAYTPTDLFVNDFMAGVGGGQFVSRHSWTPDLFHPCYWLFRQGNTLYVFVAGTDIIGSLGAHVWGDVAGYFLTPPFVSGTVNYHQYFHPAAVSIADTVTTTLAQPSFATVTAISVSGHSYGGAAAQIIAKILQDQQTGRSVECLALGSPKPALVSPSFARPANVWSLGMVRDPAIYMPPSAGNSAWLGTGNPVYAFFGIEGAEWSNLGKVGEIGGYGITEISPPENAWRFIPGNFIFADHGLRAYRDQLLVTRRIVESLDGPDDFETWILAEPQPNPPVDPGPPPSQRVAVNPSVINLESFNSPPGVSVLTPSNQSDIMSVSTVINSVTGTSPGNIGVYSMANLYKFTFFPGEAILGDSISMILSSAGDLSEAQLDQAATNWIGRFVAMLSNPNANQPNSEGAGYPLVLGYRVSNLAQKNQAALKTGPFTGAGQKPPVWTVAPNTVQDDYGSNSFNNGILLKLRSKFTGTGVAPPTFLRVTNFFVPSTPDPLVKSGRYSPAGVSSGGMSWAARAEAFGAYLATSTDLWGHLGLNPQIPTNVATNAKFLNSTWGYSIDDATGYAAGDMVQVLTANARGWNGIYRITNVIAASGSTLARIEIATRFPEDFPAFTSASCRIYRKKGFPPALVFWKYTLDPTNTTALFPPTKIATRKPARKFVPVSFRRRVRLPKTSR